MFPARLQPLRTSTDKTLCSVALQTSDLFGAGVKAHKLGGEGESQEPGESASQKLTGLGLPEKWKRLRSLKSIVT